VRAGRASAFAVLGWVALGLPCSGCTLDFDRYDPTDASSDVVTGGDGAALDSAASPPQDSSSHDATIDVIADAPGAAEASADQGTGPCMASPDCLTQAGSCGVTCGQLYQSCLQDCDAQPCSDVCRSNEQSCLGKCVSSCIACATDAGCMNSGASTACLNDSHP
jgi:hypothetical protein